MHCKLDHRVGATRATWLSLPALFVRGWGGESGVSAFLKPPMSASGTDNAPLLGKPGSRFGHKSCLTPFVVLSIAVFFVVPVTGGAAQEENVSNQSFQTEPSRYDFCGTQEWQRRTMVCRRGQNGKGYTVCENYLKYLNQSLPALAACDIPVPPKFKKPDWEEMDVQSNLQLAYEAETGRFQGSDQYQKPDFEAWKKLILEEIAAGKITPRMRKARITPTSKGEVTILGYTRDSTGCEKVDRGITSEENQIRNGWLYFPSGYVHYILTEQGSLLGIPGNYGGMSATQHELLLFAGKPYFISTFAGRGELPPREIYAVDQYASAYDADPEKLYTKMLCQIRGVQNPSSKGR